MIYEKIRPEQFDKSCDLAVRAFSNYEYYTDYIPDEKKRKKLIQSCVSLDLRLNSEKAIYLSAVEDGRIVAVASLFPPHYKRPGDITYILKGFWKNFFIGDLRGVLNWIDMDAKAGKPCHEQEESWYLNILAVDTNKQGVGIGSAFMKECIIPTVRENGGRILCLFTNSKINREFYTKNGFSEFDYQEFQYKDKTLGSWSFTTDCSG